MEWRGRGVLLLMSRYAQDRVRNERRYSDASFKSSGRGIEMTL
jgi:hypothetical protein